MNNITVKLLNKQKATVKQRAVKTRNNWNLVDREMSELASPTDRPGSPPVTFLPSIYPHVLPFLTIL